MSDAVLEILQPLVEPILEARMEPIIEARVIKEGLKRGIQATVEVLRDLGHEDTEIKQVIQKKYDLSDEETAEYV